MVLSYSHTIPILRSFDEARAREFYCGFLGFAVDWEHRFEPALPLYMQVSLAGMLLHLSEHHGDCTPGSAVRIHVTGLRDYRDTIMAKGYGNMRPGLETPDWGGLEMSVTDPASNRLIFVESAA